YDYILIDTAPDTGTFGNKAIELSDKVIIPVEKSNPSTIMPLKNYIVKLKELCRKIKIVTYESERNFIDDEILEQPNVTVLS
ncbi:AAA family ATPase, partial [Paenibacillus xylanexedens]|uniref:AAA family ATPase n=1 Tax=Paenibacillus xylanexedens TaxID=528191 RepID=UPI00119F70A7